MSPTRAPTIEDVTTVYSNLPSAVVASAKQTIEEIKQDPTKVSEIGGSFAFDLASFIVLDKDAGKLVNRGADLTRKGTNKWYDWTTSNDWPKHELKYPGKGYLLNSDR